MTNRILKVSALLNLTIVTLIGCSTPLKDYQDTTPEFAMETFLEGDLIAMGMIQDYTGKVTRRFCVDISGDWQHTTDGNLQGTVDEIFYFEDGEQDRRLWKITKRQKDGQAVYTGTAGDVIGTATGRSQGHAFFWEYNLEVPIKSNDGSEDLYRFHIKDWIYLLDANHALNRSALTKFGIEVGQLTIYFDKTVMSCKTKGWNQAF